MKDSSRRRGLEISGLLGASVVTTEKLWVKPFVNSVNVPAHAQTSFCPITSQVFTIEDQIVMCDSDDFFETLFFSIDNQNCIYNLVSETFTGIDSMEIPR